VELVLHLTDEPARIPGGQPGGRYSHRAPPTAAGRPSGSRPGRGVRQGALQEGYGGIDAVFDDTCGNPVNLHSTEELVQHQAEELTTSKPRLMTLSRQAKHA
jgi:hypothetical protein